jgi:acetyl-CoA carboxylase biotin carboxyl carrier protein
MHNTASLDTDLVRTLADLVTRSGLSEIEVERGDLRIRLARSRPGIRLDVEGVAPVAEAPPAQAEPLPVAVTDTVLSPMVGTVRLAGGPAGRRFARVGARVEAGDTLLLIEAMKTFSEVTAARAGTVEAVLVEEGQPVEFGQPLLAIR